MCVTNVNESGQVDILYYDTHKSGAISNVNVSKLKLDENKRLTKALKEARDAV